MERKKLERSGSRSEKRKVESKYERSSEDERKLWDNKKLRAYEWNQKAEPENRVEKRELKGLNEKITEIRIERNGSIWDSGPTSPKRNRIK